MGFLEKAKAAANDLAAKADTALGSAGLGGSNGSGGGEADRLFRDLGVLSYLEANGQPADPVQRLRLMAALQEIKARGALPALVLHTAPPPAPGAAGTPPRVAPTTPPPPPPSQMAKGDAGNG